MSLCPPLETSVMVQPQTNSAQGQAYSRHIPECDSEQTVQAQIGDSDIVVSSPRGV